jgi:hypothetical protein
MTTTNLPTTTTLAQAHSIQKKKVEKTAAKRKYSFYTQKSHVFILVKKVQPFQTQVRENLQKANQHNFSNKAINSSR